MHRAHRHLATALAASLTSGKPMRVPEPSALLWEWFSDLNATRTWHANGPNPITFGEIEAYGRLTGVPLRPQDVAAIRGLDEAWIGAVHKKMARKEGQATEPTHEISPTIFDAMF